MNIAFLKKSLFLPIICILLAISCNHVTQQPSIELSWNMLQKTQFIKKTMTGSPNPVDYPLFPTEMKALEGQLVRMTGYVIPIEETGDDAVLVLSAVPYSSCFFCGGAGPETIMDIRLKTKTTKRFKKDETLTFRGKLKLNDSDLMFFNYILEDAEQLSN
ncbi:MAG: hypothetical protein RIS64_3164 [Bacteroidota bacterium]|jgi:hypothetical protein